MPNKPRISVVMAMYQAEDYLALAIESVLKQSFQDFELLLVDDCSPDGCRKIAQRYEEHDARVRVIVNEKNLGAAEARNQGIRRAVGEYVAIFDADDICLPERLEQQVRFLDEQSEIFLVGGSFQYIDQTGAVLDTAIVDISAKDMSARLLTSNAIHNPTVMFRNAGYEYRAKFIAGEDYDLWLRLLSDGKKLVVLPIPVIQYRMQEKSLTHTKTDLMKRLVVQARSFYDERVEQGKDSYDAWEEVRSSTQSNQAAQSLFASRKIKFQFKNTQDMSALRKELTGFWKTYGLLAWPAGVAFFVVSFLPTSLREAFKAKVWR